MALSLDGSASGDAASGVVTSISLALTTTLANDWIIFDVVTFPNTGSSSIGIPTATGLTFSQRGTTQTFVHSAQGSTISVARFYALASSAFSGNIACTFGAAAYTCYAAYGINGANLTTPFDANVSLPASVSNATMTAVAPSVSISTSNANDMLLALTVSGGTNSAAFPSGFTQIAYISEQNSAYGLNLTSAYETVSSQQSSSTITDTTSVAESMFIVDAIQAAGGGGGGATDDIATRSGALEAITLMRQRASGLLEPVRQLWKPGRPVPGGPAWVR